jgi:hypothetical protein
MKGSIECINRATSSTNIADSPNSAPGWTIVTIW